MCIRDRDGNPQFTDYIMHNPDGYSPHDACRTVGAAPAILVFDTPVNFLQKYEGSVVEELSLIHIYRYSQCPHTLVSKRECKAPELHRYRKAIFIWKEADIP